MTTKRALTLIILSITFCIGGLVATYSLRPPVFSSHSEVIVYMLGRKGMAVERINAGLPWPDGVNYYAYGSTVYPYHLNVDVQLRDGRKANGMVECQRDRYDCRLTLTALGFDLVPMPNISNGTYPRLPAWLNTIATRLGLRL